MKNETWNFADDFRRTLMINRGWERSMWFRRLRNAANKMAIMITMMMTMMITITMIMTTMTK